MPDTPDAQQAESSTAVLEVPRDDAAYAEWRQTGKLPAPPAKVTPSGSPEGDSSTSEKPAPAPEAGTKNQEKTKPRDNAAGRLTELLADLREAGLTPAELKAFKQTYQRKQEQAAEPQKIAAPEKTENPAELKPPVKPKAEDSKTWEEAEAAKEKYYEELADYKARKAIQDYRQEQAQTAANASVHEKMMEAKGRYGDDAVGIIRDTAKTFTGDQQIPQAVKEIVGGSAVWTDLLYTLGSKPEDLDAFIQLSKSDPGAAIRKAVVMEGLVKEELAKGAKPATAGKSGDEASPRDERGKFKVPEKKESDAPPPAREVSGRGTPPPDGEARAIKDNDARSYMRIKNDEELRARRR